MNSLGAGNDLLVCCDSTIASNIQDFSLGLSFIEQVQPKLFEFSNVYPTSNTLRQQSTTIVQPDYGYNIQEPSSNVEDVNNVFVNQYIGFVSQELQSINPGFVHTYSNTNVLAPTYNFSRQYKLSFINAIKELAPKIIRTALSESELLIQPIDTPVVWNTTGDIDVGNTFIVDPSGEYITSSKNVKAHISLCMYGEMDSVSSAYESMEVRIQKGVAPKFSDVPGSFFIENFPLPDPKAAKPPVFQMHRSIIIDLVAEESIKIIAKFSNNSVPPVNLFIRNSPSGSTFLSISN